MDHAVSNSIADGVTYAIAAGNGNTSGRRERLQQLAGQGPSGDHRERHGLDRHEGVVGELRHLPGPVRAGREHHLRVGLERHRHEHDQRHVDGHPACGRRCRHLPGDEPDRHTRPGRIDDHLDRDAGCREEPRVRLAEPPALLEPHGAPAAASASSSAPAPASSAPNRGP